MRLLDKTLLTEDEGYNLPGKAARQIELQLKQLKMDSYNQTYVVRITVDVVDDDLKDDD